MGNVQNALNAYKERKKKEKEEGRRENVSSALSAYKERQKSSAQSSVSDIAERINSEIEATRKVSTPSWGTDSLKNTLDSTRESRINVSNLRKELDSYKSFIDEDTYNTLSSTLNTLMDTYDSYVSVADIRSKFESEDDYNNYQIGWLDPDAEVNAESATARREKYQRNQSRIAEIEEELDSWGFFEKFFANEANEKTKHMRSIEEEKERLQAENLRYEHIHKAEDDNYIPITDEVTQIASNRDYSNASMEDLNAHDAGFKDVRKYIGDGIHYLDDDGNVVNTYTGKVVRPADEYSKAILNNDSEGFYDTVIQDKLGMYLSATQEDLDLAYERLIGGGYDDDTWAIMLNEGEINAWKELSKDEITIYYYKLNTEGQASAYKFLRDMETELTRRATQKRADKISDASLLEQIALNIASIPMNVFGGVVGTLGDIGNAIEGKPYNPYSAAHSLTNDASAIRADTAMDIDKLTGGLAIPLLDFSVGDAYQALMSGADSLAGSFLGGTGYGMLMGMGAASSEMKELYERGASTEQMFVGGILAGAAEMVFEKVSIDHFVKMGDTKSKRDFIINLLKQGGVEASEEALTEIANTITDAMVMGSQAEVQDLGTFVKNVVNAGLGGFLSGSGMGAVGATANYAEYAQKRTEHGQDIIDDGGVDTLKQLALEMYSNEKGYTATKGVKLASKVATKATDKNVGKLSAHMEATIAKDNRTDIQNALVEKGLSKKDAKRVAEYLGSTKALTKEQMAEVEGNEKIKAVYDELLDSSKSTISERGQKLVAARLGIKINAENSSELSLRNDVDVKERVSETGKTTLADTGEEVTIDKSNPIAKVKYVDGERVVYYNTDHGVVEASNVKYSNEEEGLLYEAFTDMNPAFANAVIKNYDGSVPMQTYINGMREGMILYGMHNFQAVGKDIAKNSFLADLSEADQAFALKLGRAYAKADAKKANNDLRNAIKNAAEKAEASKGTSTSEATQNKPKEGNIYFEDGAKEETHKQHRKIISLAKHLAKAIGIDIVFYDSRITGKKAGQGANGYFDADTDTIYLDLQNAHNDAKTIAYTLSHELVHFIKKWSPQKFNTFAEFLMEQYASHGVSAANLLKRKMVELKTKDADYAYEEMIADACETMLLDSNAMVKLMELRKTDLELFEKIKLHILKILNDIREAYKSLGYQPSSDEAKALLGMKDVLEKFYSMFEEAAVDATKNYQALGTEGYNELVAKSTLNTESVSVSENGTVKLQMKQYQQTGRSTLLNYLTEQYGKDNAYDLISTIDNIYDTLAEIKKDEALSVFSNWQDTEVELDENGHPIFTTSINNGDYELNQDFSRVCKKRRQLDFVLNMLAEDPAFEASNLTKSDFVKINKAIKNHGFEIACALCFVDSKRFRQAEWADSFANTWNDILNSVVKDSSKLTPFNFATKNPNIADDGIEIDTSKAVMYRKWSEGKEDVKNRREYESFEQMLSKDDDGKWLEGNTNVRTIAALIRDNPNLRHTFRGADIIASQGFDTIQRLAPGVRSILDGWGGSSVPKPSSNDASYDSSIINLSSYNKETAYAMGGARMNSFSDFMAHMFFDYCQAFADLSAKELPSQAYTKELIYVRLFGRSGQKINMSGIAAIRDDALPTTASKNVSKAQAEANEKIEKMIAGLDVTRLLEHLHKDIMQLTEADVEQFLDMCDYVWADESINMKHATLLQTGILYDKLSESKIEECYELLKAGEIEQALKVAGEENVDMAYAKHCGTIVVGVSDAHIRKLLRDPTVRMVIPYHKSGLNPVIARELRISAYNDYTLTQTTGVKRKGTKTAEKIGSKAIKDAYGLKDFSFYDWFGKTIDGKLYDGKATADKYLEWCEKGYYDEKVGDYVYYTTKGDGYILAKEFHKKASIVPKFDAFMGEENYYKVLEDFDCYDTISGEHSAQGAVDFFRSGLPSDYKDVLVGALKEEQKVHDDFRDHLDNKGLKDEVMDIVKARGYTPSIKKQAKRGNGYFEYTDGEYSKPITLYDVEVLRSIGRKSINQFLPEDIKKAQKWAYKFYNEFGVKSPFFRAWFGDWRAESISEAEIVKFLYGESPKINYKERIVTNRDMKRKITIDSDTFGDSMHYAKVNGDEKQIRKLLGKIDEILEKAIWLDTRISEKTSKNKKGSTQFMHYLYTPISINGAPFIAKLAVEEYDLTAKQRAYNLQRIEMSKLSRAQYAQLISENKEKYAYSSDSLSIAQLFGFVKEFDETFKPKGVSKKVLNDDGTPRMFDHTTEDGRSIKVFKNDAGQIKSAETGRDANIGTFDGNNSNIRYQQKQVQGNVGYHAGDLGKAEFLFQQGRSRGTGHFGTGTYFVGNEEKISGDNSYGKRPHHAVDFTDYDLYKIKSDKDGYELHEQLREIDGGFSKEWLDAAIDGKFSISNIGSEAYKLSDKYDVRHYDSDLGFEVSEDYRGAVYKAYTEIANKYDIEHKSFEEWLSDEGYDLDEMDDFDREYSKGEYTDYLKGQFSEIDETENRGYKRFRDAVFSLRLRFGYRNTENALRDVLKYQEQTKNDRHNFNKRDNSFATVFMKSLGYEGIDVRGTRLDNVEYGSVIYDLKKDTVLYQKKKTSNRTILANALETTAQNDIERNKLAQYKEKIALIESEEEKLAELRGKIKELSFAPGRRDTEAIKKLQFEANQTSNRINTYDRQLLNLESTTALKGVLEREKKKAYQKAEKEGKEALNAYREKMTKTQRELLTRYQDSRKKGIESRKMTEMRHKIKSITSELDTLLRKPTAKKHIKEELRAEVADALLAINMDTVGADERVAHYNEMIARAKDPDIIAELTKTRDRIQLQGDNLKEKLTKLHNAYEKIKASEDIELSMSYQEVIQNSIKNVADKVGNTSIRNMTLEQLEMVYDLFSMIRTTIRKANEAFYEQKGQTITQMAEAVNDQVRTVGGQPYKRNAVVAALQREGWTLLKPYVAFRTIGSVTFTNLYKNLRAGEDTFYNDVTEATAFIEEQYEKHGYKTWDMKKTKSFTAKSGKTFDLTLEQMMTLYAYSRREQAHKHIIEGGIVFENALIVEKNKWGIPIKYEVTTKDAFNLSEETFADIANSLTAEQKAFVDAMQEYLSKTMGRKGNDVSMELLGVKLFKEEFYLPIKSSQEYRSFSAEEAGEVKLRSPAFSKETVQHANNPIVLHNFTDLWAEHINDMSMYHSFVLALEDFTRVYNYKTRTDAKLETMSTKATLDTAFPGATKYINKFLKDMNGGVRSETVGWAEKLTSLAKKGAVLGSASVAIQQPSAVMRAMAMINPKHFVATTAKSFNFAKHKQDWAELKKYAPIAGIKEMGRFDVGMGKGTVDLIKSNDTVLSKIDDIVGFAPEIMDEITWVSIWNAIKRETVHNRKDLRPCSDEFLKVAGERFTDVISLTQVYDSVFSRSDLMRNKSLVAKWLTAFMAEPTTTLNMLIDGYVQGKRTGSIKGFAKATAPVVSSVVAAIVFNALLKSIVMAARDDDEDESYAEKYLEHFVGDLKDNLNPLTLIPVVKDILSIFDGYDVERMDMSLVSDFKKAIEAFDSDNKTLYEKWSGLIGATSAFFGLPVKNVERDVRAVINTFFGKKESTTKQGLLDAISEGWTGNDKSNGQQLYEAMLSGDAEQIERVKGRFENQKAINSAIRKAIRENDPRIKEAALADYNGDVDGYSDIITEIIEEGNFSEADILAAVKAEINDLESKDKEETPYVEKYVSIYDVEHYYTALESGNTSLADDAKEDIINTAVANGKTQEEAEKSFESSFRTYVGKMYKGGEASRTEASNMLTKYGGYDSNKAYWKLREWDFDIENGEDAEYSKYAEFYEAVRTGKNLKAVIKEYTDQGVKASTLASQITSYYKPLYKNMSNSERAGIKGYLLNAYALLGYNRYEKSKDIDNWLKD